MSAPYEEILAGDLTLRLPPGARHETVLARVQTELQRALEGFAVARLLEPRSQLRINPSIALRPDLAW